MQNLTNKEREVFELVIKGLSNAEIGKALYISENTVKMHIKHILKKLGLNNRTQLVAYCLNSKKSQTDNDNLLT